MNNEESKIEREQFAMLEDQSPRPARFSLVSLEERRAFPVDERHRPVAMLADQQERKKELQARTAQEPFAVEEPKPD